MAKMLKFSSRAGTLQAGYVYVNPLAVAYVEADGRNGTRILFQRDDGINVEEHLDTVLKALNEQLG